MSKKKASSKKLWNAVIFVALVAVAVFSWYVEQIDNTQNDDQIVPTTTKQVLSAGDNPLIDVFFTDPENDIQDGLEEELISLINNAKESIYAAVFELDLQNVTDALVSAHNRGVQVRLVYDDEHCDEDEKVKQLVDAGILAIPDDRTAFMHNKFLVIDGEIIWTGSLSNIPY